MTSLKFLGVILVVGLVIVGGVLLLGWLGMVFFGPRPTSRTTTGEGLPQFIQTDFIDLDRIETISKFRSGEGHDFSSNGETCRSMKHYFSPPPSTADQAYRDTHEGFPPPPNGETDIVISSPVDGTIVDLPTERNEFGQQIYIRPDKAKDFTVRLFHVYLDDGFKKGSTLTAGQRIGAISAGQNTDIAVQRGGFRGEFVSYFSVMPDSVFAAYQARGISTREDLIVSKEARDANPLTCQGEQFAHPAGYDRAGDLVTLSAQTSTSSTEQKTISSASSDQPPLLLKSIGFELGTYDPATNRAGDLEFTKQKLQFNRLFMGYGFVIPAEQTSGGSDKANPQPTFIVPLGTKVRSLVDGVVTNVSDLYSGDVSVMVASDTKSQWMYETEHVVNPVVKVGDRVTAGQVVAEAANFNNNAPAEFGVFEIGILKGGNPPEHVCPFAYLDPSIKADVQAKVLHFYKDWEAYKGDANLYDENESPVGCLTTDPIEG